MQFRCGKAFKYQEEISTHAADLVLKSSLEKFVCIQCKGPFSKGKYHVRMAVST